MVCRPHAKKLRKGAKCLPLDGYVCRCAVRVGSSHRRVLLRRAHDKPVSHQRGHPMESNGAHPFGMTSLRCGEQRPSAGGELEIFFCAAHRTAAVCIGYRSACRRSSHRRIHLRRAHDKPGYEKVCTPKKATQEGAKLRCGEERDGCAHRCVRKEAGVRPDIHCITLPQHTPRLGRRSPAWEARA